MSAKFDILLFMIIIGITGTLGAGKGTIVEYLEKKGFAHYSARAFLTEEIKRRGMPVNRDSMTSVANDFRATHSPSYIIESLYKKTLDAGIPAVIESIRAIGEAKAMKNKPGFYLLAADAEPKIRYERIVARGSATDDISFEKFLADEQREINPNDPTKQNLLGCMALANYQLTNNGTVEELRAQVDNILQLLAKKEAENDLS